ncbi:MAG: hypothetical protein KGS72_16270 [Cyanobacteria bacterium REEB67]|nr:hypothetical protein [Cyanobacteria bacterium REEB67]
MSDATTNDDSHKPAHTAPDASAHLSAEAHSAAPGDKPSDKDSPKAADTANKDGEKDADKPKENAAKTPDAGDQKTAAGSEDISSRLMSQVLEDWDKLKSTFSAADTGTVEAKTVEAKAGATEATSAPAAADDSWMHFNNIFSSASTTSALETKAPPGAASQDSSWYDSIKNATSKVADWVDQGWDKLSDGFSNSYKAITSDSANTTSKVEAKVGADGKVNYFESSLDNKTRQLSAGEERYFDAKGSTIIKNKSTGEITTQSADGEEVYTRKSDGTETYRHGNQEFVKEKDGSYHIRDDQGNETHVSKGQAITELGNGFKAAQTLANIDDTTIKAEKGLTIAARDAQRHYGKDGSEVTARDNGIREIVTPHGKHFRIDDAHNKVEIEENGKWRQLNENEFSRFEHFRRTAAANGRHCYEVGGVKVAADGTVATADGATIGQQTPAGKMVATLPTITGKPAQLVSNPDHTSDLINNGTDTKFNPNDPTHQVERFKVNPDGSLGDRQFSFNADNDALWTPDVQFNPDGTNIDWADLTVTAAGSVYNSDGTSMFNDDPISYQNSATHTEQAVRSADSAVAAVTSKIGSQALDSGDVAALNASLGDLDGALAQAMSCGNFDAACSIMSAKNEVASAISQASQQVALAQLMRSNNMGDSDIVEAADDVNSRGVLGAAVGQEVNVLGPNAQTFEGRLAYMSQFGIAGLTEEQADRLTA